MENQVLDMNTRKFKISYHKGMNLQPILISLVLSSAIILGLYNYYGDVNTVYVTDSNITNSSSFTRFNQTFGVTNNLMNSIQSKLTDITQKGILSPIGLYDASIVFLDGIGLVLQSPLILMNAISNILQMLPGLGGQNAWFATTISTIITIVIVTLVAALLLKRFQTEI